jgi:ribonuclease P protein subunit RPR2
LLDVSDFPVPRGLPLPVAVPGLVGATAAAALAASLAVVLTSGAGVGSVAAIVVFALLAVAAERLGQSVYGATTVSLSAVPVVAAAAAGEPVAALTAAAVAGLTTTWVARSRRPEQYVFNPAALVLCAAGCVAVYAATPDLGLPARVLAGLVCGVGYFAVDNLLVALVAGLDSGRHPAEVFRTDLSWLLPSFTAYGVLGAVLGSAWETARGWGVLAFLVPPLLVRVGQQQYLRVAQQQVDVLSSLADELASAKAAADQAAEEVTDRHRQTAAALASAIDARDSGTGGHVERVTVLGQALLEEVAPELAADPQIAFGFLLHDVGKIGVPDAVLRKAGELTMAERAVMDTHPHVGWRIVDQAGFSPVVGELVLTHHERWDGTGYPRGLAGDEIPLAARLFAVVDALDAMTSDRPYRRALPLDAAFAELRASAGTQFDPACVDALIGLGADRVRALLARPDVITLPDAVPHQAGSAPIWTSMPA